LSNGFDVCPCETTQLAAHQLKQQLSHWKAGTGSYDLLPAVTCLSCAPFTVW